MGSQRLGVLVVDWMQVGGVKGGLIRLSQLMEASLNFTAIRGIKGR